MKSNDLNNGSRWDGKNRVPWISFPEPGLSKRVLKRGSKHRGLLPQPKRHTKNLTSCFWNHSLINPSSLVFKIFNYYPRIQMVRAVWRQKQKMKTCKVFMLPTTLQNICHFTLWKGQEQLRNVLEWKMHVQKLFTFFIAAEYHINISPKYAINQNLRLQIQRWDPQHPWENQENSTIFSTSWPK